MGVNLGTFADWIGSILVVFLPLVAAIYALLNGTATLAVNGKVVTRGYHLNPRKGYICLESEGSEIHCRNVVVTALRTGRVDIPPTE